MNIGVFVLVPPAEKCTSKSQGAKAPTITPDLHPIPLPGVLPNDVDWVKTERVCREFLRKNLKRITIPSTAPKVHDLFDFAHFGRLTDPCQSRVSHLVFIRPFRFGLKVPIHALSTPFFCSCVVCHTVRTYRHQKSAGSWRRRHNAHRFLQVFKWLLKQS